jgi:catechol 2,3-dioxygenase-like lactoylglutathione lyase family enzyme
MTVSIGMVTIDCADPRVLAEFWCAALGARVAGDYGAFVLLQPPGDHAALGLQQVPEPRSGKNRMHLDLRGDMSRAAEVARLVDLGARVLDEEQSVPGLAWTVLADPEGNEFCVGEPTG